MNSQRSLTIQLSELYALANRNGLSIAADFIAAHLEPYAAPIDCEALSDAYWQDYGRLVNELPTSAIVVSEHEEP